MNKTRFLALTVALLLALSPVLAAAEVLYPIAEEPVHLTYWMPLNSGAAKYITSYDENYAYAKMKENTGVDIDWIHPAVGQEKEQFDMMLLSNKHPDMIAMAHRYNGGEQQGVRDGVFLDLTPYLEQWAPDYWALLQREDEFRRSVTDNEGNVAAFCAYKEPGDPQSVRLIVHQNVMESLKLDVPTTVDEWENLFAAMLDMGTTPYLLDANGVSKIFVGAFGAYPGFYVNLDGAITYGYTTDAFRAYLEKMHDWYVKGYISKDFTSIDGNTAKTKFDAGELGCMADAIVGAYNRSMRKGNPILSTPYPRLTKDQVLHWRDENVSTRWMNYENTTAISASCKNVEAAMKFLNYAYTDAGIELLNWGVEGMNWSWVDGKRVYNDRMLKNEIYSTEEASYIYKAHFATKYTQRATECHANLLASPEALAIRFQYTDDPLQDTAFFLPTFNLDEDDNLTKAEIMRNVETYVNEMVLKFIVGTEPLESFDAYVEFINAQGLPEVLEIMRRGYDQYMAK